jgi:hypothetical protein
MCKLLGVGEVCGIEKNGYYVTYLFNNVTIPGFYFFIFAK